MTQQQDESLPDLLTANIETIAGMHAASERAVPQHQRFIETVTGHLGRPTSLYLMLAFIAIWVTGNLAAVHEHTKVIDRPPFEWLQGIVTCSGLIVSTMVLITQNRQSRIAEQRAHFDIQVNLLAEQKIAKLIGLVEELRQDLPNVRNRIDPEAEAMKQAADPQIVAQELRRTIVEAEQIVEETEQS
jgi:uncharacterized membrane protein